MQIAYTLYQYRWTATGLERGESDGSRYQVSPRRWWSASVVHWFRSFKPWYSERWFLKSVTWVLQILWGVLLMTGGSIRWFCCFIHRGWVVFFPSPILHQILVFLGKREVSRCLLTYYIIIVAVWNFKKNLAIPFGYMLIVEQIDHKLR